MLDVAYDTESGQRVADLGLGDGARGRQGADLGHQRADLGGRRGVVAAGGGDLRPVADEHDRQALAAEREQPLRAVDVHGERVAPQRVRADDDGLVGRPVGRQAAVRDVDAVEREQRRAHEGVRPAELGAVVGDPLRADAGRGPALVAPERDVVLRRAGLQDQLGAGQVGRDAGYVLPLRGPRSPGLPEADRVVVVGREGGEARPGDIGSLRVGEAVDHQLVHARHEDAVDGEQGLVLRGRAGAVGAPGRVVGRAVVADRLAGEDRVAGEVAACRHHPVVVQVLEPEGLGLRHVDHRGVLHGVGLQAVRLDPDPHAERARELLHRPQVLVAVEVGEDDVVVVADLVGAQVVRGRGVGGSQGELVLLVLLQHEGQPRTQVVAVPGLEVVEEVAGPDRRVGLDLQGVLEEIAAGGAEQGTQLAVEHPVLPQVDHLLRAATAEVVDDVGARRRVRPGLRLLARAALPGGEQHPGGAGRLGRRGPGEVLAVDVAAQIDVGDRVEDRAGDVVVAVAYVAGDAVRLHRDQLGAGDRRCRLHHGLGQGGVIGRSAGDHRLPVHQLGAGRVVVGSDRRDRGGPRRTDRDVDPDSPLRGLGERRLHAGHPWGTPPAVRRHVDVDVAGSQAVGDVGDLQHAEAGVGDLVDLTGDLDRVDEAVRPPPAEARRGRGAGLAEGLREGVGQAGDGRSFGGLGGSAADRAGDGSGAESGGRGTEERAAAEPGVGEGVGHGGRLRGGLDQEMRASAAAQSRPSRGSKRRTS